MSKAKSAAKPHKRGFRLIFQAGGPAFLRSVALFPVIKCVEVYACQIDSFDESPKRPKIKPSKYKGVVRPFLEPLRLAGRGVFLRVPPLTLSPLNTLPAGKEQDTLRS